MIGEESGSSPEKGCACWEGRKPKRLKRESAEVAKDRLVREITCAVINAISTVFSDRGNYLLQNVCGTAFDTSAHPVSKKVREQAIMEVIKKLGASVDKLVAL